MDKYYIPTIEEFHIGFEYQFLHPDEKKGWIECRLGEPDDWNLLNIDNEIEDSKIRVKYLDIEDIESLGWKFGEIRIDGETEYIIVFIQESYTIGIFNVTLNQSAFTGTIKNKSEFKKLMEQLKIAIPE